MQENRQEKSQIKQNILLYLSKKGISPYDFYKKSGVTRGVLSQNNGISEDNLARFLAYFPEVNANWLVSGTGSMVKTSNKQEPEIIPFDKGGIKQDVSDIPLYNVSASAGLDKLFADGGELLGKISVPDMPRCDGAVHVIGDSMYPLLKSGDIIAYKTVNDLQSINYGEIYILQLDNQGDISIVVKYIKHSDIGDDHIKLVSYNKEHDPKDIPLSWIQAIARVTFCIRRFSII